MARLLALSAAALAAYSAVGPWPAGGPSVDLSHTRTALATAGDVDRLGDACETGAPLLHALPAATWQDPAPPRALARESVLPPVEAIDLALPLLALAPKTSPPLLLVATSRP